MSLKIPGLFTWPVLLKLSSRFWGRSNMGHFQENVVSQWSWGCDLKIFGTSERSQVFPQGTVQSSSRGCENVERAGLRGPCRGAYLEESCSCGLLSPNGVKRDPQSVSFSVSLSLLRTVELAETLLAWTERAGDHARGGGIWIPEPLWAGSTLRKPHGFKPGLPSWEGKNDSESRTELLKGRPSSSPTGFQNCYEPLMAIHLPYPPPLF